MRYALPLVGLLCALSSSAQAADGAAATHHEPTSAEVHDAPRADHARGTIEPVRRPPTPLRRKVARAALWVPRALFLAAFYPLRPLVYLNEKYQVHARLRRVFFNDEDTFGIYPLALFETGFGLNAGARLVWRGLTDSHESLHLRASVGGRYAQLYSAHLDSGDRLGRLRLSLKGEYNIRDRDLFFGVGNGAVEAVPAAPIAAASGGPTVRTRFRQELLAGGLIGRLRLTDHWTAIVGGGVEHRTFSSQGVQLRGAANIADAFQLPTVAAFESGADLGRADGELSFDTRRPGRSFLPAASVGKGVLLSLFGGYSSALGDGPWRFYRYGAEAQAAVDLYAGTRVIVFRALLDGVHGAYDRIPFTALPHLGGTLLLRGYDTDRFRDRLAGLASAEYSWQLTDELYAFGFVDAGRVYSGPGDLSVSGLRVGYGGGIHVYHGKGSLLRVQLASSIDGGMFLNLVFDHVYDPLGRKEIR